MSAPRSEASFPAGFFDRSDTDDAGFYVPPRLVTHIDEGAIEAVGDLYTEMALSGQVLDLMSSWISHFHDKPAHLTVLGMNAEELAANPMADEWVVHDANTEPVLPFADNAFDAAVCCVSVDYLVRPLEVFADLARVLEPGSPFVCTFSNRCFPTKAVRGWLMADHPGRGEIVAEYFRHTPGWGEPVIDERIPLGVRSDPLTAVWARTEC